MGLFTKYNEIIDNNIPTNKTDCIKDEDTKFIPLNPDKPYSLYDMSGKQIGYYWNYGDTINLEWTIEGEVVIDNLNEYISAPEFIKDKKITVTFYNFKNDTLNETPLDVKNSYGITQHLITRTFDATDKVVFSIDSELSKKTFVKGVYYCTVILWNDTFSYTLFGQGDGIFEVK